jgi:hypothetical protein
MLTALIVCAAIAGLAILGAIAIAFAFVAQAKGQSENMLKIAELNFSNSTTQAVEIREMAKEAAQHLIAVQQSNAEERDELYTALLASVDKTHYTKLTIERMRQVQKEAMDNPIPLSVPYESNDADDYDEDYETHDEEGNDISYSHDEMREDIEEAMSDPYVAAGFANVSDQFGGK